ncbi:hypothetical protein SBOR_4508 [Sclerotinia borealis F-4128]|uniref:Uncharacterized protein n=1 Tax=Sclerotinia borealis (strain F-4128) TaxID=1432307 RepID=W9CEA5_SCLBF|nr:hypothetical protein SBOR_4508 [Sclerotinia borealis F-4128]
MNVVNTKPYNLPADATWLITGCSSGIGRAISELVASKPDQRFIATARNRSDLSYLPDTNPNILKLALDVTSTTSVNEAFATASRHFGDSFHLDIVVNNAGYSLSGDTECATEEEAHLEIETLFFGTARVTMKAVEVMRQRKEHRGGVIYQITSLAGLCSFPGNAYYHAVNFCMIELSGVKANFEGHSKAHTAPHPAYAAPDMPARTLEKWVNMGTKSGIGMLEPTGIAETIYHINWHIQASLAFKLIVLKAIDTVLTSKSGI